MTLTDQRTKSNGNNPLQYVGVTYSPDGKLATLWENVGGTWVTYDKIEGSANYACDVDARYRGLGFNLANWYHVYDWNADDGFNQFSNWVK